MSILDILLDYWAMLADECPNLTHLEHQALESQYEIPEFRKFVPVAKQSYCAPCHVCGWFIVDDYRCACETNDIIEKLWAVRIAYTLATEYGTTDRISA